MSEDYKASNAFVASRTGGHPLRMTHVVTGNTIAEAVEFILNETKRMIKEQHRNDDA